MAVHDTRPAPAGLVPGRTRRGEQFTLFDDPTLGEITADAARQFA